MCCIGHLCGDPGLLNIFKSPSTSSSTSSAAPAVAVDIYKEMAINLFDAKPGTVTKQQREQAKTISLGLIYGMGPLYLSIQLTKITGVKHNMQQAKVCDNAVPYSFLFFFLFYSIETLPFSLMIITMLSHCVLLLLRLH